MTCGADSVPIKFQRSRVEIEKLADISLLHERRRRCWAFRALQSGATAEGPTGESYLKRPCSQPRSDAAQLPSSATRHVAQASLASIKRGGPCQKDRPNGKNAVVTGGAQGIGRAIVERFLQSGARAAIWDATRIGAEKPRGIEGKGRVVRHHVDVTQLSEVERARGRDAQSLRPNRHPRNMPASPGRM